MNTVNVKLPSWKLPDPPAVLKAAAGVLYRSASNVMADSVQNYVPVETGTLRSSAHVEQPRPDGAGLVSVTFGYGGPAAPYAWNVHENPRSGKTGGRSPSGQKYRRWAKVGQWKYLETPFQAYRNRIAPAIAKAVAAARRV